MAHKWPESLQRFSTSSLRASLLKEPRPNLLCGEHQGKGARDEIQNARF